MAQELILNILLASLRRIEIYPKADRTLKRSLLVVIGAMALEEILKAPCQKPADFHVTNLLQITLAIPKKLRSISILKKCQPKVLVSKIWISSWQPSKRVLQKIKEWPQRTLNNTLRLKE